MLCLTSGNSTGMMRAWMQSARPFPIPIFAGPASAGKEGKRKTKIHAPHMMRLMISLLPLLVFLPRIMKRKPIALLPFGETVSGRVGKNIRLLAPIQGFFPPLVNGAGLAPRGVPTVRLPLPAIGRPLRGERVKGFRFYSDKIQGIRSFPGGRGWRWRKPQRL